ncbi:DNA repair protein RecO [Mucisphaera calidilacus]|uniref:DNA repair protein RecO n=1 Tax=Mucisphaera calidilacus TaxID=2527982 RepID=A0A518C064_9BACT|nr:DNA repair protein RecO [Mucisphaera calidilacus]QDU72611.1 DNA repair protein RecO [Mucisphaera calidilacus]
MPRFKEQAVVLRSADWSETSQLVTLLTRDHGKVRGLAKGSKRMTPSSVARFSGGIELLTVGQILGVTRPTTELATITEWDLQDDCLHLRHSLPAQRAALYAADLTTRFIEDHDPHADLFGALLTLIDHLRNADTTQTALLNYQWSLLTEAGYRPRVDSDVHTNQPLPKRACSFDPHAGGLTHNNHDDRWRVRAQTVTLLQDLDRGEPVDTAPPESTQRANRLLAAYARELLATETETMRWLLNP